MKQDKNRFEKFQARLSRIKYSQRISNPNRNKLLYTTIGFLSSPILPYFFDLGLFQDQLYPRWRSKWGACPPSKKPKNGRGTQKKRQIDRKLPLFSDFARTLLWMPVL